MKRLALGVLVLSLLLVGCGDVAPLEGVGERTRVFIAGDVTTTTSLAIVGGRGDEGLVETRDVQWFNDEIANQMGGTPDEVIFGVWQRDLDSRFVQSSRVEIAAALPAIVFPELLPEAVRWVTSQLVYDVATGVLDVDTSAAFGIWVDDPYQRDLDRLGVLRVGRAATDLLPARSDVVPIIVPDGISLGWTQDGFRYELFCRSTISKELCVDVATSSVPLRSLLP